MGKAFLEARLEKRLKLGIKDCTYGPCLSRGLAGTWQDPLLSEIFLLDIAKRLFDLSTEQSAKTPGAGDRVGCFYPS